MKETIFLTNSGSERDINDPRPLEQKRHLSLDKLVEHIALGNSDSEIPSILAETLVCLEQQLDSEARSEMEKLSGGKSLSQIAQALLDATNPEKIEVAAQFLAASEAGCGCSGDEPPGPTPAQVEEGREIILKSAVVPIVSNHALRQYLIDLQRANGLGIPCE